MEIIPHFDIILPCPLFGILVFPRVHTLLRSNVLATYGKSQGRETG